MNFIQNVLSIKERSQQSSTILFTYPSYVRLMLDLPLCNARLFKEAFSIHPSEIILPQTKSNPCAELTTSSGPRSTRARVFQTFRILLLFNFFSFWDVFSIETIQCSPDAAHKIHRYFTVPIGLKLSNCVVLCARREVCLQCSCTF